jgi:hypothetical protein
VQTRVGQEAFARARTAAEGAIATGAHETHGHAARCVDRSAPIVPWPGAMSQRNTLLLIAASSAIVGAFSPACGSSGTSSSPSRFDAGARDALPNQTSPPGADGGGAASGEDGGPGAQASATSPAALVRFAAWAPDAPAAGLDLCVKARADTSAAWTGPLLGAGVAFPRVGAYSTIRPGSYDVRVVAAGDSSCAPAAGAAIALPVMSVGTRVTVALMGALSPVAGEQPAEIVAFTDDVSAPPGQAAVRFIDALTGVMSVVFGTGKHGDFSFVPLTGNVSFGTFAASLADGGAADPNGYLPLPPRTAATLSVGLPSGQSDISFSSSTQLVDGGFVGNPGMNQLFGPGTDIASAGNAAWPAGSVVTIALVNGRGGGGPQLVQSHDNSAPQGSLSDSAVLSP